MISTLISLFASTALSASPASNLVLPRCKLPDSYQFASATCPIQLHNTGDKPIAIRKLSAANAEDSIAADSVVVPAHGTVYIEARVAFKAEAGHVTRLFRFETDEPGQERRNAEVVGFVGSALDEAKPSIDFGVVNVPGDPAEKTLSLSSREIADFRVTKVLETPDYIDARIGDDGRSVTARIKPGVSWGLHEADHIRLAVNTPNQAEAWVTVKADVHGNVVPDVNPLSIGLLRQGNRNEFLVRLTSRDGKEFDVGKVKATHLLGSAKVEACAPARDGCKLVRFVVAADQPTGAIGDTLRIELPGLKKELPVVVWGMLVGAQTKVRDLNEEMKKAAEIQARKGEGVGTPVTESAPRIDLQSAVKTEVERASETPPAGSGPLLRWAVQHESSIQGYAIYRSDTESGPFVRINKDTVPTRAVGEGGASYQWRDNSAVSGRTYWYYVGVLNKDASKANLTPPQKVVAK